MDDWKLLEGWVGEGEDEDGREGMMMFVTMFG